MRITASILAALSLAGLLSAPALAADPAATNWTGFYLGGHLGASRTTSFFTDPNGSPIYGGSVDTGGLVAGFQAGYNHQIAPQWVLGVEGEWSWLGGFGTNTCQQATPDNNGSNCKVTPREVATLTGRFGFLTEPHGRTMLYGKAGIGWMRSDASINPNRAPEQDAGFTRDGFIFSDLANQADPVRSSIAAWGPVLGAGVEYALSQKWSLKMEYDYLHLSGMSLTAPETTSVTAGGIVNNMGSGGSSHVTQNLHMVKLGLNYRFGGFGAAPGSDNSPPPPPEEANWTPGWEFDVGTRFWYSSGRYQNQNGSSNLLVSRLTYNGVVGQSGEIFARADTPVNVFVKGFVGAGGLTAGKMYDEDWGLSSALAAAPTSYEVTQSDLNGTLHYITGDIGYNFLRGPNHKVGVFVGYNRYETTMNAMGCAQLVQPSSGVCEPALSPGTTTISQIDAWQSVRLGVSAEAMIARKVKINGDFAWLPYVLYDGLDIHRVRNIFFPVQGTGKGVQAEVIVSWMATENFGIGIGGRYWSMWTNYAAETTAQSNIFEVETERHGVFLQASYKFKPVR